MTGKGESIAGCLLGTAVGDAIGLPYEGLSPERAKKMLGPADRHRFLFGRGMVSDDTQHTCMVAQALLSAGTDSTRFSRAFAWRLRFWLLGVPAGAGFATLRAILKLWLGFSPQNSGVFSAGNGPAMRAAIFGAAFDDLEVVRNLVTASTVITHTDPKALHGALAIALAAFMSRQAKTVAPGEYLSQLQSYLGDDAKELVSLVAGVCDSIAANETTEAFASRSGLGKGVSGYILHTVPVVLHAWLRHQREFAPAISEIIACGGDADTTAAILGGIIGSAVGPTGIPEAWLDGILEWPANITWMRETGSSLADSLAGRKDMPVPEIWFITTLPRNLLMLIIVLLHGFRRLLPPY